LKFSCNIADEQGKITQKEYLELMCYEQPEYYQKFMRAFNHWDEMGEDEFEQIMNDLFPQEN